MTLCPSIRSQLKLAWADLCERAAPVQPDNTFSVTSQVDEIIRLVVVETGIPRREIMSKYRGGPISSARQLAMYLTRRYCPHLSLPRIAREFGRDHTTVFHALQVIPAKLKVMPDLKQAHDRVVNMLEAE